MANLLASANDVERVRRIRNYVLIDQAEPMFRPGNAVTFERKGDNHALDGNDTEGFVGESESVRGKRFEFCSACTILIFFLSVVSRSYGEKRRLASGNSDRMPVEELSRNFSKALLSRHFGIASETRELVFATVVAGETRAFRCDQSGRCRKSILHWKVHKTIAGSATYAACKYPIGTSGDVG